MSGTIISEFHLEQEYVIFENPESKLRMTFDDWRHFSEAYYKWVGHPTAQKRFLGARNAVRHMFGLPEDNVLPEGLR